MTAGIALDGDNTVVFSQVGWTRQLNGASPALCEDLAILAPGSLPLVQSHRPEEHDAA